VFGPSGTVEVTVGPPAGAAVRVKREERGEREREREREKKRETKKDVKQNIFFCNFHSVKPFLKGNTLEKMAINARKGDSFDTYVILSMLRMNWKFPLAFAGDMAYTGCNNSAPKHRDCLCTSTHCAV